MSTIERALQAGYQNLQLNGAPVDNLPRLRVRIEHEDYRDGVRCNELWCPLARALKRLLRGTNIKIEVGANLVKFYDNNTGRCVANGMMSGSTYLWVANYDECAPVIQPFLAEIVVEAVP